MTLLDAARRLAEIDPSDWTYEDWLAMPQIVAALEAAEQIVQMIPTMMLDHHDCPDPTGDDWCPMTREPHHVYYCDGCDNIAPCDCDTHEQGPIHAHTRAYQRLVHHAQCPLGSLEAALRDEKVTA